MGFITRRINAWRRRRILADSAIDTALWQRVVSDLQVLDGLSPAELTRLRELATLFLDAKSFYVAPHAADDLTLDDYMLTAVAAQACLAVLNITPDDELDPYPGWVSIVLFPDAFVTRHNHRDEHGIVHQLERELEGEVSELGPMVLSWADSQPHRDYEPDGANVVLHEFAHKLDFQDGVGNGCPPLHPGMSYEAWSDAFSTAFEHMNTLLEHGHSTPIDEYAATDPVECFAVFTEEFFERPHHLQHVFPDVYAQLSLYYRQDPGRRRPHMRPLHPAVHHAVHHPGHP